MVGREDVQAKIALLRKYNLIIEPYQKIPFEAILTEEDKLSACERDLLLACQSAIDLADILCKIKGLEHSDNMADGFNTLRIAGILSLSLSASLTRIRMVGLRRDLLHSGKKLSYEILKDVLQNNVADLKKFEVVAQQLITDM